MPIMATGSWRGILFFIDFNNDLLAAQLHRKVMQQIIQLNREKSELLIIFLI